MTTPPDRTRRPLVVDEAVAILARTPGDARRAAARPAGRAGSWRTKAATPGVPFDVVGHLIHGERTDWVPRARIILEHGEARAFDPFDRLAQFAESEGRTLASLLDEFATLRQQSLRELADAAASLTRDLDRRGRHPAFGVVTLGQLLATWVAHDLDHVTQISRVLARQYSDEVGPWRAYLRIIEGPKS